MKWHETRRGVQMTWHERGRWTAMLWHNMGMLKQWNDKRGKAWPWNKTGHPTRRCWNKPPYYCLKCKAQGHTLSNSPDKGKKKSIPEESTSQGEGRTTKRDKKDKGETKAEDQSLLMLASTKESSADTIIDTADTTCQNGQEEGDAKRACNLDHRFRCNESHDSTCSHLPQHSKTLKTKNGDDMRERNVASQWSRIHPCSDKNW